jgi:hypothetical protein
MTKLIAKSSSDASHRKEFFGTTKDSHRVSSGVPCMGLSNFLGTIAGPSSFPSSRRTRALFLYSATKLEILPGGAPYCLHGDNMVLPVNSAFAIPVVDLRFRSSQGRDVAAHAGVNNAEIPPQDRGTGQKRLTSLIDSLASCARLTVHFLQFVKKSDGQMCR